MHTEYPKRLAAAGWNPGFALMCGGENWNTNRVSEGRDGMAQWLSCAMKTTTFGGRSRRLVGHERPAG